MRERKCGVQDCLVGRHGRAEVQGVLTKGLVCADHSQLQHQQGDEAGWKREEDERRRAGKQPCTPLVVLCAGQLTTHLRIYSHERLKQSRVAPFVLFAFDVEIWTWTPRGAVITKSNNCLRAPRSAALSLVRVAQRHWAGHDTISRPWIRLPA
jgi:hypothetical protein